MRNEGESDYWQVVWIRFKSGDSEAFAILYNRYIDTLFNYGSKLCKDTNAVKDSLQELFLELFLNRETIKTTPETLKYYLLLALKRNLIKKMEAARKVRHDFDQIEFEPEYSIEFKIIENEKGSEINRLVLNALRQLPSGQREALYLRFNEALEYAEIANILEITVESVRKQVHRALKTIRQIIKNESFISLFFLLQK